MQKIMAANIRFSLACCLPGPDGKWILRANLPKGPETKDQVKQTNTWQLVHATTRDGVRFEILKPFFKGTWPWTDHLVWPTTLRRRNSWRSNCGSITAVCLYAFSAPMAGAGKKSGNPLSTIALTGPFLEPELHRYVCTAKTLQPFSSTSATTAENIPEQE